MDNLLYVECKKHLAHINQNSERCAAPSEEFCQRIELFIRHFGGHLPDSMLRLQSLLKYALIDRFMVF